MTRPADVGGAALAGAVRLLGRVRTTSRPMHPHGTVRLGRLHRHGARPATGIAWLDRTGSDPVVVRFSRGAGLPRSLPDVGGLAVRIGSGGGADLLFSSTGRSAVGRYLLLPRRTPAAFMTTLMPLRSEGGPVVLAVRRTTTDVIELSCASATGPWRPFGGIVLEPGPAPEDPTEPDGHPSFDPTHVDLPGLTTYDWARRLRGPSYAAARRRRSAPDPAQWGHDLPGGATMSTDGGTQPDQPDHPDHPFTDDELADEMSEESFPSSDPPSTWAGPHHT